MYPIRTLSNLGLLCHVEELRERLEKYYLVSLSTQQEQHFFIF